MQLPEEIQLEIEKIFENVSPIELRKSRESLTSAYKEGNISPFSNEWQRLAYLGARMPATFAAIHKVLQTTSLNGHLLDLGAGPGTATIAASSIFPGLEKITLIEQNREAIAIGKKLFHSDKATWVQQNLLGLIPKADAAILSYVLCEIQSVEKIIENCWNAVEKLIIIEPGTPKSFQMMKKVREQLIGYKAHILAPCPHSHACLNDWCHFSARVERTRLHRLLKEGSLGYEDEKFCYLIASKSSGPIFTNRIIRHPIKQTGKVKLSLCTSKGNLEEKIFSKKDKELYRYARDCKWGDTIITKK